MEQWAHWLRVAEGAAWIVLATLAFRLLSGLLGRCEPAAGNVVTAIVRRTGAEQALVALPAGDRFLHYPLQVDRLPWATPGPRRQEGRR